MECLNVTREPSPCPSGPDDEINNNEYRIAFRVSKRNLVNTWDGCPSDPGFNAYFLIQTSSGDWVAKELYGNAKKFDLKSSGTWIDYYINTDPNASWEGFFLSYDGDIKYLAIGY